MSKKIDEKENLILEIIELERKLGLKISTNMIESNTVGMLRTLRDKRLSELEEVESEE